MNTTSATRRIVRLTFLTTVGAWLMGLILRNVVAYALPIDAPVCGKGAQSVGVHLKACASVDRTQFFIALVAGVVVAVLAGLLVARIRGVSFRSMIRQWNKRDYNDSPALLFLAVMGMGMLMTTTIGVTTLPIMLFTLALRIAGFFFVGTPAAVLLNVMFRGDVQSVEDWIERYESQETNGPALITIVGLLFGLAYAMSIL